MYCRIIGLLEWKDICIVISMMLMCSASAVINMTEEDQDFLVHH